MTIRPTFSQPYNLISAFNKVIRFEVSGAPLSIKVNGNKKVFFIKQAAALNRKGKLRN